MSSFKLNVTHVSILSILVLPANILFRFYLHLSQFILAVIFHKNPTKQTHHHKIQRIQSQIQKWGQGKDSEFCGHFQNTKIQVDDLTDILKLDVMRKVVKVEPMVRMGDLTNELISNGWTLPLVPQFEYSTVGGLVLGGGVETSSHKYGLFHETCGSYEIVLNNGHTIICSKDLNLHLFKAIPFSNGTLGVLTAVEIKIIEAKRFVQLKYDPFTSIKEGLAVLKSKVNDPTNDFVEAIVFNKDNIVIITGKMVTSAETYKVNRLTKWHKPWFFKHVDTFLTSGGNYEYIPLEDYYGRHDRSSLWITQSVLPFGNDPWFRHLFGWVLPLDLKFVRSVIPEKIRHEFDDLLLLQDFIVPPQALPEFLDVAERLTQHYPIWLCPLKMEDRSGKEAVYFNIGFYGIPSLPNFSVHSTVEKFEALALKYCEF